MNGWVDTHIHLAAATWQQSPGELVRQALALGIKGMVVPGVRVTEWPDLLELARQLPEVCPAPGLHPLHADQWTAETAAQLIDLAAGRQVVAIGEIGLDALGGPAMAEQEQVFRAQLTIALEAGLPVLLHSRKTTGRVLDILQELNVGPRVGGIWHGFSGSVEVARELFRLGFKIGVGPVLLRANARKLPRALCELPDQALVLETDAPDMIDSPAGLLRVASRLAELKGWTPEQTARMTSANARQVLRRPLLAVGGGPKDG